MKKMKTNLQYLALFVSTILTLTACGNESATTDENTTTTTEDTTSMATQGQMQDTAMRGRGLMRGMMGHMHQNMQQMRGVRAQMTGDPDYDFA